MSFANQVRATHLSFLGYPCMYVHIHVLKVGGGEEGRVAQSLKRNLIYGPYEMYGSTFSLARDDRAKTGCTAGEEWRLKLKMLKYREPWQISW